MDYMTTEHVAKLLSVTIETVRRKIRSRELKAIFKHNRYYVTTEALKEYMELD